jgi:hypothetical protein
MKRMEVEDTAKDILHGRAKTGEILALRLSSLPKQHPLLLHMTVEKALSINIYLKRSL